MRNATPEISEFLWFVALLVLFYSFGLWLSRRADRSPQQLRRYWFIHMRWANLAFPAAILTWIAVLHHSNENWLSSDWSETSFIFLAATLVLAPPLLALLAYQLGAAGLIRRAVEPGLRFRNVFATWFWGALSGPVALCFLVTGLVFAAVSQFRLAAVLSGAAGLCYLISQQAHWKSMGVTFEPIPGGDLRDRILAIARAASIRPASLRLLRSSRRPFATAFAASGNAICISATLVENLPKAELDAIAAHELAHLRHHHHLLILPAVLVPLFLFIALFSAVPWPPLQRYAHFFALLPGICLAGAISRYFERKADRLAASLIPEPAILIRALARITSLNLLPTSWSGWDAQLFSHPSLEQRAAHIASAFHLPLAEVLPHLS
ncbi:MAG: M48 family metalloprotease, partial [Acidobacteria bacterium]|nr:M48 family metalloprotease [Acidobacteriota bacterium]